MISRSRWLPAAVWIAGIAGLIYCASEAMALVALRTRVNRTRADRQSVLGRSEMRALLPPGPTAGMDEAEEQSTARPRSRTPGALTIVPVTGCAESAMEVFASDPALQNLYLAAENAEIDVLYLPLYRRLCLGPPQLDQFRSLVLRRLEQRMDLSSVQRLHRLPEDELSLATVNLRIDQEFSRGMHSLLGGSGYQCFVEYERALPVRRVVNECAGALALNGAPLTPEQADDLTRVLAEASPPYSEGAAADPNQVDWQRALKESEKVLNPPQQRVFTNIAPGYTPPPDSSDGR